MSLEMQKSLIAIHETEGKDKDYVLDIADIYLTKELITQSEYDDIIKYFEALEPTEEFLYIENLKRQIEELKQENDELKEALTEANDIVQAAQMEVGAYQTLLSREMTDDTKALQYEGLWIKWRPYDEADPLGPLILANNDIVSHNEMLYRVVIGEGETLKPLAHQPPDADGMLAVYRRIQAPAPEGEVLPWLYGEAVEIGDKREYNGIVYECYTPAGANIYTPDLVPAIWKVVP